MSSVGGILLEKDILLESGTNELEVLVFRVADFTFGINVAKVREVLPRLPITSLPKSHSSIRGVFKLRNRVIPCVSLIDYLGITSTHENPESRVILADFNSQQTAFMVDEVERIHRLSWETVLAVPSLMALANTPMTAVARCDNRLIVMLDFEMIIDQVTDHSMQAEAVDNPGQLPRSELRVLLADDSPTVRRAITHTLRESGYTRLEVFQNGKQAWDWIERRLQESGSAQGVGDLLISDVEMPHMDGLHLTKRIKDHPQLRQLPVLLYSSIVTPDNYKKGQAVGADAQISKPELHKVVQLADDLIGRSRGEPREGAVWPDRGQSAAASDSAPAPAAAPEAPTPAAKPAAAARPASPAPAAGASSGKRAAATAADRALWQEFQRELATRARLLREQLDRSDTVPDADTLNDVFRTLHTVKSAAMVVPVDEVARVTHLVEELIEPARTDRQRWPQSILKQFADWLSAVSAATRPEPVLAQGTVLASELAGLLAGQSA